MTEGECANSVLPHTLSLQSPLQLLCTTLLCCNCPLTLCCYFNRNNS